MSLLQKLMTAAKAQNAIVDNASISMKLLHKDGNVGMSAKTNLVMLEDTTPEGFANALKQSEKVKLGQQYKFKHSTGKVTTSVNGKFAGEEYLKHESGENE